MFSLRHRVEFLAHLKPCDSQSSTDSGPESGNWTLVDEGGEEVGRNAVDAILNIFYLCLKTKNVTEFISWTT